MQSPEQDYLNITLNSENVLQTCKQKQNLQSLFYTKEVYKSLKGTPSVFYL